MTATIDLATFAENSAEFRGTANAVKSLRINYGPRDLLGRFFLMAGTVLAEHGISLSFGSFDEIVEANRANADSWLPLVPTYDPKNGLCAPDRSFALIGREPSGRIVTTQGLIVFDWSETSLKAEAESMRLFYADPDRRTRRMETCRVTAPTAAHLCGIVGVLGGAWWHPSIRGQLLSGVLSRYARAYAFTRWRTDLTLALNSAKLIARNFPARNGYQHAELGVELRNFELGDYDGGIAWINGEELFDDLSTFLGQLEARIQQPDVVRTSKYA
jgi:hypothetical protein